MSVVAIKNYVVSAFNDNKVGKLISGDEVAYGGISNGNNRALNNEISNDFADELSLGSNATNNSGIFSSFDPRVMSDVIIGLSDGLTVPFALTAGLSSLGDTKLVITGGFAELVSGAISMGLGGYLAAKSESQYYHNEVSKEKSVFFDDQNEIDYQLVEILEEIGITSEEAINSFIEDLQKKPTKLVNFIIRYGKGLEEPAENRQLTSALTIGSSYFIGGFIPLIPYFFVNTVGYGLIISCVVMSVALFAFGYVKTVISLGNECSTVQKSYEGVQMFLVGGFAATCAWLLVRLIEN